MCIGRAERDGTQVLILGFSHENLRRLQEGQPMLVDREHHGDGIPDDWEILILAGKTEEAILQQLKDSGAMSEATQVFKDPRL